jgi:pyocin large subunit-like protein
MRDPNAEIKQLEDGQTVFYQAATNTLVIVNPNDPDCGTMFKPDDGRIYFDELK